MKRPLEMRNLDLAKKLIDLTAGAETWYQMEMVGTTENTMS